MLVEDSVLVGCYRFHSKGKDGKPDRDWFKLSFKQPMPDNGTGENFGSYLMDPAKVDDDPSKIIGSVCIIDVSGAFCNKIITR